jgi:ABC-2 type transport system ATP-binding protein
LCELFKSIFVNKNCHIDANLIRKIQVIIRGLVMIQIEHLSRHYDNFIAVDDVSFEIQRGEVVGLLGHNGAGKTTIMKMMTAYLEPTSGNIFIDKLNINKDIQAIQKRIGYLPENCPVWPEMTVIDYLEYQALLHGVTDKLRQKAVAHAIGRTALKEKATQTIQTLSRGYRQRVGVAQAILHNPDIIILDEPTNGLDPTQIRQMRELIHELAKSATVIISTHILQEVQAVCDRVLIMRAGKLVVDSKLDELQSGQHLIVTVDNNKASDYLQKIDGVKSVKNCVHHGNYYSFSVDAKTDIAPQIATAIYEAGDKLYSLQPEVRNLESVFSEVNSISITADKEVNHA